jgi:hypothetical protein
MPSFKSALVVIDMLNPYDQKEVGRLDAASLQMMERNMDAEICDAKEVEWRR